MYIYTPAQRPPPHAHTTHCTQHTAAALPAEWGAWTALKSFSLSAGPLAGALPAAWSNWTPLQRLSLRDGGGLGGGLPAEWTAGGAFPELRSLELANMPALAVDWPALRAGLEPKGGQLARLALSNLGGMANVSLDAWLPSKLTNLSVLVLSGLNLSGPLPDWSGLPAGKLQVLDLSGNALEGPPPAWAAAALGPPPVAPAPAPGKPRGWVLDLSRNKLAGGLVLGAEIVCCMYTCLLANSC